MKITMTKNQREYEKLKDRVTTCFEKWRWTLGLSMWKIELDWVSPGEVPTPQGLMDHYEESFVPYMSITPHPEYLIAYVAVDASTLEDRTDRELDEFVAHELVHAVLSEMHILDGDDHSVGVHRNVSVRLEEKVTTMLARALVLAQETGAKNERERLAREAKKKKKEESSVVL